MYQLTAEEERGETTASIVSTGNECKDIQYQSVLKNLSVDNTNTMVVKAGATVV